MDPKMEPKWTLGAPKIEPREFPVARVSPTVPSGAQRLDLGTPKDHFGGDFEVENASNHEQRRQFQKFVLISWLWFVLSIAFVFMVLQRRPTNAEPPKHK